MTMVQPAPGQEVGRSQPQTTKESPGGPFIRYTQPGNLPQYTTTGLAFGGFTQTPLVGRPGYYRDFRVLFTAYGGVNGTNTVAMTGNGAQGLCAQINFKDPFGTLIFSVPSYEAMLIHLHSGGAGCGLGTTALYSNLPSYSAPSTGGAGTGNFQWSLTLPLEFTKGIGSVPGANQSLQPQLSFQLNPTSSVYSTAPGTAPSIAISVESDFYWLPDGNAIEPPALGTSRQWILQQGNPTVASGGNQRVVMPRMGGFLDTLIIEALDTTGTRVDVFPAITATGSSYTAGGRLQLIIDGVPIEDSPWWKLLDDYYFQFRGITRPTGVYVYTRKPSLNQQNEGLLDTNEATLSTNPGTAIELGGVTWATGPWTTVPSGTSTSYPATINVVVGQIVPRGKLIQGLPEV